MKVMLICIGIMLSPSTHSDETPEYTMTELLDMDQAELVVHVNELYREIGHLRAQLASNAVEDQAAEEAQSAEVLVLSVVANDPPDTAGLTAQISEARRALNHANIRYQNALRSEHAYGDTTLAGRYRDRRLEAEQAHREATRLVQVLERELSSATSRRTAQATTIEGDSVELIFAGAYLDQADQLLAGQEYAVRVRRMNGQGGYAFRGFADVELAD